MPRKSSKTTHVMNLLANSQLQEEMSQDTVETIEIIKYKTTEDPVADIIRKKLESEFHESTPGDNLTDPLSESPHPQQPDHTPNLDANPPYSYVNVMEVITREKAEEFCSCFDMCVCSRCLEDVIALALSNLPPKYIVKDCQAIPPLLNYYRTRYLSQVTVSLTKACLNVKENPRH